MSTDEVTFSIWFGVAGLLTVATFAAAGWQWQADRDWFCRKLDVDTPGELGIVLFGTPVAACFWPVAAVLAVLTIPFWAGRLAAASHESRRASLAAKQAERRAVLTELRDSFDRSESEWGLLNAALRETTS